jgi:hypothetical protein
LDTRLVLGNILGLSGGTLTLLLLSTTSLSASPLRVYPDAACGLHMTGSKATVRPLGGAENIDIAPRECMNVSSRFDTTNEEVVF